MQPAELRPIETVRRADLVTEESQYQSERCWIVKDPLALKYYRLQEAEYAVLQMLDGRHSLTQIRERLQQQFPAAEFRLAELQQLIVSFQMQGLLTSTAPGLGRVLLERQRKQQQQKLLQTAASLLSIRFPGVDPDRFLTVTYPWVRWLFSLPVTFACLALMASAGLLLLSDLPGFYRRLPEFYSFFSGSNLLLLAGLMVFTKILHELGHGYTCKHFGGQCHEIGLMLLVFMPTLYCNTSDSWVVRHKWQRIAIGAAGMYVELTLASACTWIWWMTQPGWLHFACLNIMFLSGVSAVIFNGNPLLRYDAYYMLSDWLEIPNLTQKSRAAGLDLCRRVLLGMPRSKSRSVPNKQRELFVLYSVASFLYRWFIVFSILWFLSKWFEPYGLEVVGHTLMAMSLGGMVLLPAWQLYRFFEHPGRRQQVRRGRLLISMAGVGVLVAVAFFLPLPRTVRAPFVLEPEDATRVFVKVPARILEQPVAPHQFVREGEEILSVDNLELKLAVAELEGERGRLVESLVREERLSRTGVTTPNRFSQLLAELKAVESQLAEQTAKLAGLRLAAPRDGFVIPAFPVPRALPTSAQLREEVLPGWWGSPFDPSNLGATLDAETQVCWIGELDRIQAELIVEQSEIQDIVVGQPVSLRLDEYPGQRIRGEVVALSPGHLKSLAPSLASTFGGPVEVKPDSNAGGGQPIFRWYQVSVAIHSEDLKLSPGFRGEAKIYVRPMTVAQRVYRWSSVLWKFR